MALAVQGAMVLIRTNWITVRIPLRAWMLVNITCVLWTYEAQEMKTWWGSCCNIGLDEVWFWDLGPCNVNSQRPAVQLQ